MSSVSDIINAALHKARSSAGESTKTASAPLDIVKEAHQVADALEYLATDIVNDGTAAGQQQVSTVREFFKQAEKGGPAESVAPTGTQKDVPASGAKKILPTGLAGGSHPEESGAPTGTQATIDQTGKNASAPRTLLDVLSKLADGPSNSPEQSKALNDAADPGSQNENSNIKALDSEAGIVGMTKRDAKLPTRARLKQLFANAGDTGPSSAAAQAAFPQAYAKGGMKVADEPSSDPHQQAWEDAQSGASQFRRGKLKDTQAHKALGLSLDTREHMSREGLKDKAEGYAKTRTMGQRRSAGISGALGMLGGAALGGAATGRGAGAAIGGLAGGALGGLAGHAGYGAHSRKEERIAREISADPTALRAHILKTTANPRHMHQENAAIRDLVAAREGRNAEHGGLLNINLNRKDPSREPIRSAGYGEEKAASLVDYANLFDKAASGELGDEAKAFAALIEQVEV